MWEDTITRRLHPAGIPSMLVADHPHLFDIGGENYHVGILDALDRGGLWDSTAVFVVTDHGHYLGEHDIWGKPPVAIREQMGHIPLLVHWPGVEPGSTSALTSAVDINATLHDIFGVQPRHTTHGTSLAPLLRGETESVRDVVLSGIWAREVHLVTDRYKLAKAATDNDNHPLSLWSNRWSTHRPHGTGAPLPYSFLMPNRNAKAFLDFMPDSDVPVLRQPHEEGDHMPMWALAPFSGEPAGTGVTRRRAVSAS